MFVALPNKARMLTKVTDTQCATWPSKMKHRLIPCTTVLRVRLYHY